MTDFTLYGKCGYCPRKRFFIRKREVPVQSLGLTALSQKKMCNVCYTSLIKVLKLK